MSESARQPAEAGTGEPPQREAASSVPSNLPLLLVKAREVATRAYAPYSGCRVGAALVAEDGRVFFGCNVENASYGLSICAERVAIGTAVAAGVRRITALAVTACMGDPPEPRTFTPCGACRQVMAEFMDAEAPVTVDGAGTFRLGELLPQAFQFLEK